MKVDEFRLKLKSVSDRHLQRMLETAESLGPAEALQWIREENRRRESATFHKSAAGKKDEATASLLWEEPRLSTSTEELGSQIRPLSEVLGEPYATYGNAEEKATAHAGSSTFGSDIFLSDSNRHELISKLEATLPQSFGRAQGPQDISKTQILYAANSIAIADLGAQNGFEGESIDDLQSASDQINTPGRVSRGLPMIKVFVLLICLLGAVILGVEFLLRLGLATR